MKPHQREKTLMVFGSQIILISSSSNVDQAYCNTGWKRALTRTLSS